MTIRSIALVSIATALLTCETAMSCSSSAPPYFDLPTYIDLDYTAPSWAEVVYNRATMFTMLLDQYVLLSSSPPICSDDSARAWSRNAEEEAYSAYLRGADYFQNYTYDSAIAIFAELASKQDTVRISGHSGVTQNRSWVREAASYMLARTYLVYSQDKYDGYTWAGSMVDTALLRIADSLYVSYSNEYPNGLYASSARDIRRKIFSLTQQHAALDADLRRAMRDAFHCPDSQTSRLTIYRGLVEEFCRHFKGRVDFSNDSPMLLAYALLGKEVLKPEELEILEAREQDFAPYPNLFRFLRALCLYRLGQYTELLEKTPEQQPRSDVEWVSTQTLRARSLARTGESKAAIATHTTISKVTRDDQVRLDIAVLLLNSGEGLSLFSAESPVISGHILRAFATYGLSDQDLETGLAMSEVVDVGRKLLVNELALRHLLAQRYKQFVLLLDSNGTSALKPVLSAARKLSENPADIAATVELADFLYANNVTPGQSLAILEIENRCKPCEAFSERVRQYDSPLSLFLRAVALARSSGERNDSEAKALHYIVNASRHSYRSHQSTWKNEERSDPNGDRSRKAFRRLHKLYKDSPWAVRTPYWFKL